MVHPDIEPEEAPIGDDEPEGPTNSSLGTSRVPPQDGQRGDFLPPNRPFPGNDQRKGRREAEPSGRTPAAEDGKRSILCPEVFAV